MVVIDLKISSNACHTLPTTSPGKDSYVRRIARLHPSHELHASEKLPSMRREVSGQFQRQKLFMSRSVSSHGFRTVDLPREPSGYRGLSPIPEQEALPYGHTWQGITKHLSRGKRNPRLAYLCRLRPLPDRYRPEALYRRADRSRSGSDGICAGCHDHRSLLIHVSLGQLPTKQGCCQTSHATGPARPHSDLHPHLRREAPRGQCVGHCTFGSGRFLCHGPWIHRFSQTLRYNPSIGFLRHPGQIQSELSKGIIPRGRSKYRSDL